MNKLAKLTINKFRNVAPTTLEFHPRFNVLLGRNAAGKTTLLRLLSTLLGTIDEPLSDELLSAHFQITGDSNYEQTTERKPMDKSALPIDGDYWGRGLPSSFQQTDSLLFKHEGRVILKAESSPNEIFLEFGDTQLRKARKHSSNPIFTFASAISSEDNETIKTIRQLLIDAYVKTEGRMDESLDSFENMFTLEGRVDTTTGHWSFKSIPFSMFSISSDPIPDGTTKISTFPFLDRAAKVIGYESATARFDIERISSDPNQNFAHISNLRLFFKRSNEEVSHDWLSYGQKRLLSFFSLVEGSPDVVIADELVNGLHHEWISACLHELGERQAFLTSQNPLLLDFLRFNKIEEVRQTFILCERNRTDLGEQLVWRNFTEDEAESFFLAYQTGMQRVSDILLTKGLW
jgi:energy-coupling factor transporter ATP-binding protein EcfA2